MWVQCVLFPIAKTHAAVHAARLITVGQETVTSKPYHPYRDRSYETNGLAIGSLVTSVAGGLLGIPLSFVCFVGILIPIVGAVLGVVALSQIKRTNQQGRGLAIAGIVVGATAAVLLVLLVLGVMAAAHSPSITPSLT